MQFQMAPSTARRKRNCRLAALSSLRPGQRRSYRLRSDGQPVRSCNRWLRYRTWGSDQLISLVSCPRPFGGRQWYFVCPVLHRQASVLWMPPGAKEFCSRHAWGRQVAYRSQFQSVYDRGHAGKAKIKARLIGDLDPEEWELPPKP